MKFNLQQMRCYFIFIFIVLPFNNSNAQRIYYQEPTWNPRAILPYADAIKNNFWPASPAVEVNYKDTFFDESKLSKVPAPGIYPRVLITPEDLERIRARVTLGDKAPPAFKVMWQRVSTLQSPFYALVTNNDSLGRRLAMELVQKIKRLSGKITEMDKRPDRDNIWVLERSIIASGEPDPPNEIWDLLDYDYLHKWMTGEEREMAGNVIARIVKNRISNFLMVPDHFMINNHEGFGMEYIRLMLLIEGLEGFDQKLFDLAVHKTDAMLSWFLDKDGMCYESIKGWLNTSAFVAVGLRNRQLLRHSHLRAKMDFFLAAIRWEDGAWHIRDEMRASAFHVIWMMHYFHPTDKRLDFLFQSTFSSHTFLTDANAKWPNPVGICNELLLLFAEDKMTDANGKAIDWTNQAMIDQLNLPTTWHDSTRGYVEVRNSWNKEDLKAGFVCKQDFFYGGHEGSENNRITLWKDGVNWIQDNNMLATKATFLQNMITIDGKGLHWPPVAGNWLGIQESKEGVLATGDGKMGYSYTKVMQVHPLSFPSAKLPYYTPFTEGNFDLSRDLQIAFQPATIKWNDGYAHTDYGPWSGETRLVEDYKPLNEVEKAYRTVQVAKGKYPYVLVVDDIQKDNQKHSYDWNISVPVNAELVDAVSPEIVFQNTEPSNNRVSDMVIAARHIARDSTGKALLKKGEPLCLVRVLWRTTEYGFPIPRLEKFQGHGLITVPANAVSPEFRVLIYPFLYGEPLPTTSWNNDRTTLTVEIKGQKDVYQFASTAGGRTAIAMKRDNLIALKSNLNPAKPVLIVRGKSFIQSDFRYTRFEKNTPAYLVNDQLDIQLKYPDAPAEIHYTIDGSVPTVNSTLYIKPITIKKTCTLNAKTFYPDWQYGNNNSSELLTAKFILHKGIEGMATPPAGSRNGLGVKLFEINTKLYNDKGFFDAGKIMMPDVRKYIPTYSLWVNKFELPELTPTKPLEEQIKGFYQFSGWFYAKKSGIYNFHLNSCGPVTLDISNQSVIEATGIFHQQQETRSGETALNKGWHSISLVICDPLFWNVNSLEKMPLALTYQMNESEVQIINTTDLKTTTPKTFIETIKPLNPIAGLPTLEPGMDLEIYDRTGKRRDKDFLDIDHVESFLHQRVNTMEAANTKNSVRAYNGYFHAATTGMYIFHLPFRIGDNASLGGTQASCQSQLKIGNEYILQRGVYGRNLTGKVYLKEGWHAISFRFGTGVALCSVELPGGQIIRVDAKQFYRPALVNILIQGNASNKRLYELYDSMKVSLAFPKDTTLTIRYTLDGTTPTIQSVLYKQPLNITQSVKLTTIAFKNNKPASAAALMEFKKVNIPQAGSLGVLSFNNWDGKNAYFESNTKFNVWIDPSVKIAKGMQGKAIQVNARESLLPKNVDVNVSRGTVKCGFKIYGLNMRENALTVSIWFKPNEVNGKLFGKDGYNAFGKAYRTVSCSINNGKLFAMGNSLSGGEIKTGTWQQIVLSVSEQQASLYLNGVLIASGNGTKDIITDALDFFTTTNATVDNLQLFDRFLDKEEVKRLFLSEGHN